MDNAELILTTLDRHLDHPVRLILYGRAALQLGFCEPPPEVAQSKDVDGIVAMSDLRGLIEDAGFWDAVAETNSDLENRELYLTHLFQADQVFLRRQWESDLLAVKRPPLRWLRLFRPATVDLILTKMMRGDDPQDMADIEFMVRHDRIASEAIESAFHDVLIPDIPELHDAFERAKPRVRRMVNEIV